MTDTRTERDALGGLEIPADAYWGIHTERARRNFPISGRCVNPALIRALAQVKLACALTNRDLGYLEDRKAEAVIAACREIAQGGFSGEFPVDAFQGGAGTSTNMNMNEVVANRAVELLEAARGHDEVVHPIENVNLHQSTNDVFPTAVKIAAIQGLRELSSAVAELQGAFQEKEKEFGHIVTIGRTELQDAVPMTLGVAFSAFAEAVSRDRWRTFKCEERLRVVNIGGTAVGTGLTAPRDYIFLVIEKLRDVTGLGLARGENIAGETANADSFVEVSGILKAHAANLIKIANDLRTLNATGEIRLGALQAGSSIMPGKVNPVMMEAAIQTGIKVMANDWIVAEAAARGTLQINEFLPLLADALLESLDVLTRVDRLLAAEVKRIEADEEVCRGYMERSPMVLTAFLPFIGYDRSGRLLAEYAGSGETNIRAFLEKKLGKELVEKALSPYRLTALGYRKNGTDTEGK
ncbi:MAG: Aspartate ammonia-lyase [Syntrophaceae bacterium PtaU1.Bin231]|nr:MAG: Aspartate ammonia-lyase [Syntrophaceae bacterium PtaU1.Bin231]